MSNPLTAHCAARDVKWEVVFRSKHTGQFSRWRRARCESLARPLIVTLPDAGQIHLVSSRKNYRPILWYGLSAATSEKYELQQHDDNRLTEA